MIISDPTLANAPPGRAKCNVALCKYTPPTAMGFACDAGDLNRFNSRYRSAKSFRGIELEGYTENTVRGYAALLRVFLTYTSFEQFMDCCGLQLDGMEPCLKDYNVVGYTVGLRSIENHREFLTAVSGFLAPGTRQHFEAFLTGNPCNILYLAAGIRHIFAHGQLTPNAGAGYTAPAREVCHLLVELLFAVMDGEFTNRLRANKIMD